MSYCNMSSILEEEDHAVNSKFSSLACHNRRRDGGTWARSRGKDSSRGRHKVWTDWSLPGSVWTTRSLRSSDRSSKG